MNKANTHQHQRGAVAIEFAVLFLIFFATLYAIIAYSLPLLLALSFQHTSAEAGRAIYKVSPAQSPEIYRAVLSNQVNTIVEKSWLPPAWRQGDCHEPTTEKNYKWQALDPADNGASYGYIAFDNTNLIDPRFILHTCLQRGYNKSGNAPERAIIPIISFLGIDIPSLPMNSEGEYMIKGESITRL